MSNGAPLQSKANSFSPLLKYCAVKTTLFVKYEGIWWKSLYTEKYASFCLKESVL